MISDSQPGPFPPRRWLPPALYLAAVLLTAVAAFRFGALSTIRGFALAQPTGGQPNPFEANYLRYLIAVLWPLPAAAILFASGVGFGRGRSWPWIGLLVALVWLGLYLVIKPPSIYYYWLAPVPSN